MGQILRFIFGGYIALDALIVILGILLMGFIAWTAEWRGKIAGGIGKQAIFAAALGCLLIVSPCAEEFNTAPVAPPMSSPCDVPAIDIAAPARFPM